MHYAVSKPFIMFSLGDVMLFLGHHHAVDLPMLSWLSLMCAAWLDLLGIAPSALWTLQGKCSSWKGLRHVITL